MSNRTSCRVAAAIVLVSAVACGTPTENGDPASTDVHELVAAAQVSDSVIVALNSGIPDRRRLVVRSAAEWAELWREATSNLSPSPAVPQFDFDSEMLLVATMGARPSGGYAIAIDSVYAKGGTMHTVVRETSPDRACLVTAAITTPVVAVRVARTNAPVEFTTRTAVHLCW